MDRIDLAVGAWKGGEAENAELIIDTVAAEEMTPRIAARVYVAKAGFRAELQDYEGSWAALGKAAPFLDAAFVQTRGCFYSQRGRINKRRDNVDAALTDYSGAVACWEEAGNKELQGAAYLNLAELYLSIGNLSDASQNLNQALAIFRDIQSFYLPQAYDTEAKILLAQDRPALAYKVITKALGVVERNETWQQELEETKRQVQFRLLDILEVKTLADCDRLKVVVTEKALRECGGSLSAAGRILDATHHAVSYIVDQHKELEPFRVKRRVYRRSIIKH